MASALRVSMEASVAWKAEGRSTFPYSMPGRFMSEAYWCLPVTNARPSTFGTGWPAIFHWSAGVVGASSLTAFISFAPLVSCPKPSDSFVCGLTTFPSATTSEARSACQRSAARSRISSRAAAATFRSCGAMVGVVRLPNVPMSKGVRAVSPITR